MVMILNANYLMNVKNALPLSVWLQRKYTRIYGIVSVDYL